MALDNRKLRQSLKAAELQIDEIDQLQRADSLEIHGLPAKDGEDLIKEVTEIGEALGVELQQYDIKCTFRLSVRHNWQQQSSTTRTPIAIVKFNNLNARGLLIKNRRHLRNAPESLKKVYLNENLTKQPRKLLGMAREYKKINKFDSCWTTNGKIYLKKDESSRAIQIASKDALDKLSQIVEEVPR